MKLMLNQSLQKAPVFGELCLHCLVLHRLILIPASLTTADVTVIVQTVLLITDIDMEDGTTDIVIQEAVNLVEIKATVDEIDLKGR